MTARLARALTYSVVALLAVVALRATPPLQSRQAADVLRPSAERAPVASAWTERVDTLGKGEALIALLERSGLAGEMAQAVLRAATALDHRRIPAGLPVTVGGQNDSLPSEVVFALAIDRRLRLRRVGDVWSQEEERLEWTTDTIVVTGTITSTLSGAMDQAAAVLLPAGERAELTWTLADIFEYRIDMSRDLQEGDAFRALVERQSAPNGLRRAGRVLTATFTLSGAEIDAVRFASARVSGEFFDRNGKSLRAAFLRTPVAFRRISSVFGVRRHPILGVRKAHRGVDYAATSGTPVRAVGDGVVLRAGWSGGYGNLLEIRHRNGFVTRYGHLRAFGRGVRAGSRVTMGSTVAYVGSTGLSTGPHLHFEVLVGGVHRDPRVALRSNSGDPLPAAERPAFDRHRTMLLAVLEQKRTDLPLVAIAD